MGGELLQRGENMSKDILVVDDQPGIRLLLKAILMREGYNVTTASDGREAFKLLSRGNYDLVILDYRLPILDGVGVLEEMKQFKRKIPAVIMSGLAEKIENELSAYPQVKLVLAKPFNIDDIPVIVKQSLNRD